MYVDSRPYWEFGLIICSGVTEGNGFTSDGCVGRTAKT